MDEHDYLEEAVDREEEGEQGEAELADASASSLKMLADSATETATAIAGGIASGVGEVIKDTRPVTPSEVRSTERPLGGSENQTAADRANLRKQELIKQLERVGDQGLRRISPEAFLSRTERLLLNNIDQAFEKGDVKSVQDMLGAIAENPNSVKAVMNALKARMEGRGLNQNVRWESGTDSDGQSFVRLHVDRTFHTRDNRSTTVSVMIGSDGTNSGSSSSSGETQQITAHEALEAVTGAKIRRLLQFNRLENDPRK